MKSLNICACGIKEEKVHLKVQKIGGGKSGLSLKCIFRREKSTDIEKSTT